ncbi:winged helix-turn-helix transcriptional regulator [Bacillus horti]|uniref:DNA-binding HxlR family transcriptional regulator n=1 Tax=Caldalkalibacillus horti TaxID=77523 RepID=A0ABT9VXM3_9BACI|nr:helix-turn-helix domain-containing protein [Bacillus horti]MDQ0165746.1 DNA-binding HxlR family transcriptional regulator [Bacillus horti]
MPYQDGTYGCPVDVAVQMISGKWKPRLIFELQGQTRRFGELHRLLPGVSKHVLTVQLRELEKDGIISRTVIPTIPPQVNYNLTEFGSNLTPILEQMIKLGEVRISKEKEIKDKDRGEN